MEFIKKLNVDKVRNLAEDAINQARPKTEVEAKVYEVLSHKNWGSSSTQMNDIANDSFDYEKFGVITKLVWEALENQRPAAWRVVFKGLTLLEHLIKNGSERCVDDGRNHSHVLRALYNFNYYEGTVDRGVGVREKAKQLVELLGDDERIREERAKAKQLRDKFGVGGGGGGGGNSNRNQGEGYGGYSNDNNDSYNSGGGYGGGGIGSSGGTGGFGSTSGGTGGFGSTSGGTGGFGSTNPDRGYSGRYSDTNETSGSNFSSTTEASEPAVPTFAALPEKKPKKSKKLKKAKSKREKAVPLPSPTTQEPATDLFALNDPSPDSGPAVFDAFGQNESALTAPAPVEQTPSFDAFASSAPVSQPAFDAFGSSAPTPQPQPIFDAFSSAPVVQAQPAFDAFANSNPISNPPAANTGINSMTNMFGNMNPGNVSGMNNMQQQQQMASNNSNIMGGDRGANLNQVPSSGSAEVDDFGDFEGASNNKGTGHVDPISKLISLDGLSKNKQESTDNALNNGATSSISTSMAFAGVDGLNRGVANLAAKNTPNNRLSNQSVMMSNVPVNNGVAAYQGQMGMMGGWRRRR